eukprot:1139644-Pelagomonas_calceolata.AAC.2
MKKGKEEGTCADADDLPVGFKHSRGVTLKVATSLQERTGLIGCSKSQESRRPRLLARGSGGALWRNEGMSWAALGREASGGARPSSGEFPAPNVRARGPSPAISKSSREEGRQLARAALLSSKQGRGSSSSSWAAAAAAVCYTGEGALDPFEWEEAGSVFYVRGRHLRMPARTLMQRKRAKHAAQNNYNPVMHTFTD